MAARGNSSQGLNKEENRRIIIDCEVPHVGSWTQPVQTWAPKWCCNGEHIRRRTTVDLVLWLATDVVLTNSVDAQIGMLQSCARRQQLQLAALVQRKRGGRNQMRASGLPSPMVHWRGHDSNAQCSFALLMCSRKLDSSECNTSRSHRSDCSSGWRGPTERELLQQVQ